MEPMWILVIIIALVVAMIAGILGVFKWADGDFKFRKARDADQEIKRREWCMSKAVTMNTGISQSFREAVLRQADVIYNYLYGEDLTVAAALGLVRLYLEKEGAESQTTWEDLDVAYRALDIDLRKEGHK